MTLTGAPLFSAVTLLTCLSFSLIGYDNGVFGGVVGQPAFNITFNTPGATLLGFMISVYELGCFAGSILCSIFGESLGRKKSMFGGGVVMLIGAILQATSYGVPQIIVARIISGLGMGFINSTAPVYQSEFSPKSSRGIWACAMLSTLNLGIFLAYWITYGFSGQDGSYSWRVPVILQCMFIIPIIFLSLLLPESPRWLVAHGRDAQALDILKRSTWSVHQDTPEVTLENIQRAVIVEKVSQVGIIKSMITEDDVKSRRRLLIACAIQFFQQLGGINGIIYYAGTIFASIGFDPHTASLVSGLLFTWFFVASFIPWFLIERIGRRPLFLIFISLMAVVFAVMAGLAKQIDEKNDIAHVCGIAAAAMLFLYMGSFTIGFQATVWVYPPEILPLKLRQTGTALAASCNWIINFMVVQVTPVGIQNIGWRYYIIYAVFNASFVPVIYFFFPETKGLALEDVDRLFATGEGREILAVNDNKTTAAHNEKTAGMMETNSTSSH